MHEITRGLWYEKCRVGCMAHRAGLGAPGRAQRYPLQLPVRFRVAGETRWHRGQTENISDTGVVIRTDDPVAPATPVVVVIALPPAGAEPGGQLRGAGRVVRRLTSSSGAPEPFDFRSLRASPAFAVTIEHYEINRELDMLDTVAT